MIVLDIETIPGVPLALAAQMCVEGDPAQYAATTPALAKIVCAGVVNQSHRKAITGPEIEIVANVLGVLADKSRWPLVTFNGRRFDLPVIMAAAMRHEIEIPFAVLSLMNEYRFSKEPNHVDLYDLLTNYGSCRGSLRAWCVGLGIGDPKSSCDGSDVARLIDEDKIDAVAAYCLEDCDFTMKLYERWLARVPQPGGHP